MKETYPVIINDITKVYRKWDRAKKFLTIKSALLKGELFNTLMDSNSKVFYALKNISYKVKKGITLGIIGKNGSGKSTLLKIIAGITKPAEGYVKTNGKVTALLELGAGFHPEISGRENIFINGIMLGLTKRELNEKFDDIVEFSELEDFIDAPVKTYSSGMYMRLAFSVAINVNPDILLIDEVLAVGDKSFTNKCLERIKQLKQLGKTIIFVSHSLQTIEMLCDEVIWLDKGKLINAGKPRETIEEYLLKMAEDEEKKINVIQSKTSSKVDKHNHLKVYEESHQDTDKKYLVEIISEPDDTNPFPRKRWGSREAEIRSVEIFDNKKRIRWVLKTGEDILIRIHYKASKLIKNPVIGIGIYRIDDLCIFATNTFLDKFEIDHIEGEGFIDIPISHLNLLPNIYFLDVAIHTLEGFPYDYHYRLIRFKVYSDLNDLGICRLSHKWEIQ